MLVVLELPQVLAPDLSTTCFQELFSVSFIPITKSKDLVLACLFTFSHNVDWKVFAPAAIHRNLSRLASLVSGIELNSPVSRNGHESSIHSHLADRSETLLMRYSDEQSATVMMIRRVNTMYSWSHKCIGYFFNIQYLICISSAFRTGSHSTE